MALSDNVSWMLNNALRDGGAAFAIVDGINRSSDFIQELNVTTNEINRACDDDASVETVAATRVLTVADSRKTIFLAHATEFDVKLPPPAVGLRFKFIVGLAPSGANYTITTDGTTQNVIHGLITTRQDAGGNAAATNGTPVDVVTFVASKAVVGDWVELICDGVLWYLQGACYAFDAITLS